MFKKCKHPNVKMLVTVKSQPRPTISVESASDIAAETIRKIIQGTVSVLLRCPDCGKIWVREMVGDTIIT